MTALTAVRASDRAPAEREGLRCRVRLADGRVFSGPLAPERHRALQLGVLHATPTGWSSSPPAPGATGGCRSRPAGGPTTSCPAATPAGVTGWPRCSSSRRRTPTAARRCSSPPPSAQQPRGGKEAVTATRFLWVDVDQPGQLHALWAFLAQRPCHLLVETAGSGGVHAYWKLAEPLPADHDVIGRPASSSSRSSARTCG